MAKTLKEAQKYIISRNPHLSVWKESRKIEKDFLLLITAYESNGNYNKKVEIKDEVHLHKVLNDSSITKRYVSSEIIADKEYLAFIELGIEYLRMTQQHEDAEKGFRCLNELIYKETTPEAP